RVLLPRSLFNAAYPNGAPPYDFVSLYDPAITQFNMNNPAFNTASTTTKTPFVFDTWSQLKDEVWDYSSWATQGANTTIPLFRNSSGQLIRILAIQITIRIWDNNTRQSRQTSIVVDL